MEREELVQAIEEALERHDAKIEEQSPNYTIPLRLAATLGLLAILIGVVRTAINDPIIPFNNDKYTVKEYISLGFTSHFDGIGDGGILMSEFNSGLVGIAAVSVMLGSVVI